MFHCPPMRCEASEKNNNKIRKSYYRVEVVLDCSRLLWIYLFATSEDVFPKRWQETSLAYPVGFVGDLQRWISTKTNNYHRELETDCSRKAKQWRASFDPVQITVGDDEHVWRSARLLFLQRLRQCSQGQITSSTAC